MSSQKHNVVIVGGGIGGVRAAWLLSSDSLYDVTLISNSKSFVHRASLYRDKNGRSKRHITIPLQRIFGRWRHDLDLVRAHVKKVDPKKKVVITEGGIEYEYDSLIVSLKSEGRKIDKVDRDATYSAYSSGDMDKLRRRLITNFESGDIDENYVVVGGGEAGVEMAGELKRLLENLSSKYSIDKSSYRIILIEAESRILPKLNRTLASKVLKRVKKLGIHVLVKTEVESLHNGLMRLSNNKSIRVGPVITAAGTESNHFYTENKSKFLLSQEGFVRATSLLEAEGYNDIYIIGNSKDSEKLLDTDGILYDAEYVADIMHCKKYSKAIPRYEPPSYKTVMELGKRWAVYNNNREHYGFVGWYLKRWLDRKHFSTLLPKRIAYLTWLRGSRHDEIQ